ncbi:MAG: pyridoxamine 5'-phosphate oxidase family protein [Pseudomonadales bacterium]|nr:pyridoxamine 5'-phosphate oxidase family protein [Pseudomonadales bacterium]
MSQKFPELLPEHIHFIQAQQMFFTGTAGTEGKVNVSPKGIDSLRVMNAGRVLWLNLTGSGNETAAHVLENARMTLMFCSFDTQPLILRLYGKARVVHPIDSGWKELSSHFPAHPGARQIFDLAIDLVQTSCGFAVPRYEFIGQRDTLLKWAEGRGEEGIRQYWQDHNRLSLDGKKTGIEGDGEFTG